MEKYKKASFLSLIAFLILSVPATFFEGPFIFAERELYFGGKFILHLWLVRLCFLIKKDAYKISHNLEVGTMMMAFTIHGQYFSPWYMFVYHELIIAFSFLFPLPKRIFNTFAVIACMLYLTMMLWRFENIHSWLNANSRVDWIITSVAITVVAVLSHTFFTSDRNQRDSLMRKFGLVGFQTATVVHDVKSMLASPRMNVELLKKKLSSTAAAQDVEVQELLNRIDEQISNISKSMTGLNQVVALQQQGKESLQLKVLIHEVSALLNFSKRNIDLNVSGDHEIYSERSLLKSILFNVLMNSIQAFRNNPSLLAKIQIRCIANGSSYTQIEIIDNAGGYPCEVLKSLQSEESAHATTGMGLFLISTGMQSLDGSAHFTNAESGAAVRLNFPNRSRLSSFPLFR